MQKKYVSREKCNGSGVIVFYEKWLNPYFVIMKCCVDCMIWFKLIDKCIMSDDKNLYMCAIYILPDKNVFYRKYECDIFDVLQEEIELYSVNGNVAVIGDLNGRVGKEPDFLRHDNLNKQLNDNIANFIEYVPDDIFCGFQIMRVIHKIMHKCEERGKLRPVTFMVQLKMKCVRFE